MTAADGTGERRPLLNREARQGLTSDEVISEPPPSSRVSPRASSVVFCLTALLGVIGIVAGALKGRANPGNETSELLQPCSGDNRWEDYRLNDVFWNSGILGKTKMFWQYRTDQPSVCVPTDDPWDDKDRQLTCLRWLADFFRVNYPDTVGERYLQRLLYELSIANDENTFTRLLERPSRLELLRQTVLGEYDDDDIIDASIAGLGSRTTTKKKAKKAKMISVDNLGAATKNDDDVVVIHLRVGDVLDIGYGEPKCSSEMMHDGASLKRRANWLFKVGGKDHCDQTGQCKSAYVYPRQHFEEALNAITRFRTKKKKAEVKTRGVGGETGEEGEGEGDEEGLGNQTVLTRAVLVTGSAACHSASNNSNDESTLSGQRTKTLSDLYVHALRRFLEKQNGLTVTVVSGNLPDDDLRLMAGAKNFVGSGGGFSELVGELVQLNGGYSTITSVQEEIGHEFRRKPKPATSAQAVPQMVPLCTLPNMTSSGCTSCWLEPPGVGGGKFKYGKYQGEYEHMYRAGELDNENDKALEEEEDKEEGSGGVIHDGVLLKEVLHRARPSNRRLLATAL